MLRTCRLPWMILALVAVALGPAGLDASAAGAKEEPYLSVRTGLRCSACHVNRTGGGGRNDFGSVYAQTRLSTWKTPFIDRSLNDFLSVGANFRVNGTGVVSERPEGAPRTSIDVVEASVQLEARVIPDVLAVYVDQLVAPGGSRNREAFALVEGLPLDGFIKAGRFFLPYGYRLPDDGEFIRARTGFTYATPDEGLELGIEPGPLSLFVAVTNGTAGSAENNSSKQVSGTAAVVFPRFRVGASASRNDGPDSRRDVVGGFAGLGLGRLTLLGELDYISDSFEATEDLNQFAAYVEGSLLAARGLNLRATYGFLDPDRDIGENARTRFRIGAEWFPVAFSQLSLYYTLLEDIPQATTDTDVITFQLHMFF